MKDPAVLEKYYQRVEQVSSSKEYDAIKKAGETRKLLDTRGFNFKKIQLIRIIWKDFFTS